MAEGAFPEADAAAARALIVLIRDVLAERAPLTAFATVDVQSRISSSLPAASDTRTIAAGTSLLTIVVQRVADSVVATTSMRMAGAPFKPTPAGERFIVRADDIVRLALSLARIAAKAGANVVESMGTTPPSLGSVEAGDAFIYGLAEALSTTPVALGRAYEALTRASAKAPTLSDVWRWRARVERSMLEWSRTSDPGERDVQRASFLASAQRAAQLAPRSADARLVLSDALLVTGALAKAQAIIDIIARENGTSAGIVQRRAVLSRVKGDDSRALLQLLDAIELAPRDARVLVELATVALSLGRSVVACHALNHAIAADETMAPAYALRAIVRGELRDRRSSWIDAEVATRLGHPEWGERAAGILDVKYGDRSHAAARLRPLGGTAAQPTNYLDAILLARANVALSQGGGASLRVAPWTCREFWWSVLVRDARTIGASIGNACTGG